MATYDKLKERITKSVVQKMMERKKRDNPRNDRGIPQRLKVSEAEAQREPGSNPWQDQLDIEDAEEAEEAVAAAELQRTKAAGGAARSRTRERGQQRGITENAIKMTAIFGEPKRAVGGAIRRTMNRKTVEQMINRGFPAAEISECVGTVVITKDPAHGARVVTTVRPTEKNGPKRGRKYKPKYGRPHDRNGDSMTDGQTNQY